MAYQDGTAYGNELSLELQGSETGEISLDLSLRSTPFGIDIASMASSLGACKGSGPYGIVDVGGK